LLPGTAGAFLAAAARRDHSGVPVIELPVIELPVIELPVIE